jgi:hypothetical protein
MNQNGPKAPTAVYGPLGLKYHPIEKANTIVDCLENHFMPCDLCDENQEQWVKAKVTTLSKPGEDKKFS